MKNISVNMAGTLFSLNDINHINLTYILKDNKDKKVTNIKAENVT